MWSAGAEGKWGLRAGRLGGAIANGIPLTTQCGQRGEQWTPQYCANHETGSERERDGKSRYAAVMRRALFITVGSVLVVLLMIILLQTGLGVDSDVTITDRNRPEIVGNDDD